MALFDLIARLRLDGTGFQAGMSRAERTVNSLANTVRGQLAAAFSVAALTAAVKKTIDFASSMTDLSEALGVNAETLQEFDYAARQTGATVDDFAKALKNLAQARREALEDPAGKQAKSFGFFGVDATQLKNTKEMGELAKAVGRGYKALAADANSIPRILDLIGSKNIAVLPAMAAGLDDAAAAARNLGLIMDNEVREGLDEIGDSVEILQSQLTVGLAPAIIKVVDGFTKFWTQAQAGFTALFTAYRIFHPFSKEFTPGSKNVFTETFLQEMAKAEEVTQAVKERRAAGRAARAGAIELPDFEEEMKRSRGGGARSLGGLSISSDPLIAVGNYLGSSGDSSAVYRHQSIVNKLDGILRAVEEANRRPGIF